MAVGMVSEEPPQEPQEIKAPPKLTAADLGRLYVEWMRLMREPAARAEIVPLEPWDGKR